MGAPACEDRGKKTYLLLNFDGGVAQAAVGHAQLEDAIHVGRLEAG